MRQRVFEEARAEAAFIDAQHPELQLVRVRQHRASSNELTAKFEKDKIMVTQRFGAVAAVLIGRRVKVPGPLGRLLDRVGPSLINEALEMAGQKLREINSEARAKQDYLTATLTGFRVDLDTGEEQKILLRSLR